MPPPCSLAQAEEEQTVAAALRGLTEAVRRLEEGQRRLEDKMDGLTNTVRADGIALVPVSVDAWLSLVHTRTPSPRTLRLALTSSFAQVSKLKAGIERLVGLATLRAMSDCIHELGADHEAIAINHIYLQGMEPPKQLAAPQLKLALHTADESYRLQSSCTSWARGNTTFVINIVTTRGPH
jgi:hypothetical protein